MTEPRLLLLPGGGVPQLDKIPISKVCREKRLLVEEKPAVRLPLADAVWVWLLLLGNVVPLFVWRYVEGWTTASLALYAGR